MDEKVENNSRRSFFKYAGLGAAGLLLGGYSGASWKQGAPIAPQSITAGRLSISQGETTRWTRYPDFSKEQLPNFDPFEDYPYTEWEQVELDAPVRYNSINAWMTDIDLINEGDNMKASLNGVYGGEDYYADYDPDFYIRNMGVDFFREIQFVGLLLNRHPHNVQTMKEVSPPNPAPFPYPDITQQALKHKRELDSRYEVLQRAVLSKEGNLNSEGLTNPYENEPEQNIEEIAPLEVPSGVTSTTLIVAGQFIEDDSELIGGGDSSEWWNPHGMNPSKDNPFVKIGKVKYSLRQVAE